MKCLFTLSLALLFLSSKVLSQNPNMFDFHITCNDNASPACSAMDTYNRAGQIISDNLILNTKIIVEITVERRPETFWGATYPAKVFNNLDDIRRYFPTALIKQVQPGFPPTGTDIFITINSSRDPDTYYPGTGQIQANQHDFLELVLHELQHGLGFETVWYQLQGNDLFPDFDYTLDNNGVVTFQSFKENIFDYFLVVHPIGRGVERTTPYVQALNTMAGPFGKTYNNMGDFYNGVIQQQQQQGKSYTKSMLSMATLPYRMSFMANDGNDPIALETTYNPFKLGSSISHFAKDVYSTTSDFLLISESQAGKTLEDKVAAYGNDPGEGMGPDLRSLLATMGYELRIPGSPPVKSSNKITTNNSTDSKLKSVVNNRNKKKRIVAL
uniref:Uncharacterized protein n=1 Tax=Rhizophagus irregularis (strain DAOM 181602 / DAOM 197198 / MUCL 43194) TaxID=747089 RepID=U9UF86_RHIID